jgi:hypothetical protein
MLFVGTFLIGNLLRSQETTFGACNGQLDPRPQKIV